MKKKFLAIIMMGIISTVFTACSPKEEAAINNQTDINSENETDVTDAVTAVEITEQLPEESEENEKENEKESVPTDAIDAYYKYLGLVDGCGISAVIDKQESFMGLFEDDDEIYAHGATFDELTKYMEEHVPMVSDSKPVASFAFVDTKDSTLLALKYQSMSMFMPGDSSNVVCIFNYVDDELHLTYSFCSTEKKRTYLSESCYLNTEGYSGSSHDYYTRGYIDEYGKYNQLINEEVLYSWDCSVLNDLLTISIDCDIDDYYSKDDSPRINMHVYNICGKEYVYAEAADGCFTESDNRFLNNLSKCGVSFIDTESVDEKYWELIETVDKNFESNADKDIARFMHECQSPVIYTRVKKQQDPVIPIEIFDDTVPWNFISCNETERKWVCDEEVNPDNVLSKIIMETGKEVNSDLRDVRSKLESADGEEYILVQETGTPGGEDYYRLYLDKNFNGIVVTPNNTCIRYDDGFVDFMYETLPQFHSVDLDSDGDYDLVIIASGFHGAGFYQEAMTVVENQNNTSWFSFHLTPQQYSDMIGEFMTFTDKGSDIGVITADGDISSVLTNKEKERWHVFCDNYVKIELCDDCGKNIILVSEPTAYGGDSYGIVIGTVRLELEYEGYGNWIVKDFKFEMNEHLE